MANQISGDAIDAIRPDLEAFASLWSALRTNYQGTNITKTVARLLHMYQPEDGVLAYERLLRTLYVLLEDFNSDGLRLLVSMVPPPKGVPDEIIRRVFRKATGFLRLDAPIFHKNNTGNLENDVNSSSSAKINDESWNLRTTIATKLATPRRFESPLNNAENPPDDSTILDAIVKTPAKISKSPKIRPRESEEFHGFPSNEITNTESHARNMRHFYGPTTNNSGYSQSQRYVDYRQGETQNAGFIPPNGIVDSSACRIKWLEAPILLRKNNYQNSTNYPDLILKTSDNKYIRLPMTKINGPPPQHPLPPPIGNYNNPYNTWMQNTYQTYYPNNQIHLRNNDCNWNNSDLSRSMSNNLDAKKSHHDGKSDELFVKVNEENLADTRISNLDHDYGFAKADHSCKEKENFQMDLGSPNSETIDKFRDTVKNSQRAIQEDIYRMDVVRSDEDIVQTTNEQLNNLDTEILTVTEELKKGACDFLKRAEEQVSLKIPRFPKTRILQDPENNPPPQLKFSSQNSEDERLSKCEEKLEKIQDSSDNCGGEIVNNCCIESPALSMKISTQLNKITNKGTRGKIARNQAASKLEKTMQKMANSSNRNSNVNSSFGTNEDKTRQNSASIIKRNEEMQQGNSVSELVNYRKQYYDALLSIQRAKVAVANSLAISSSGRTTPGYDPRVLQYLQQQHHQLQHQRVLMTPQHPAGRQPVLQSGYSNIQSAAGLWIRRSNDYKYSPYGQYAFPPHRSYPMSTSSSCSDQVPINATNSSISKNLSGTLHNLERTIRPSLKRRKLEDIVGQLRDTDSNN